MKGKNLSFQIKQITNESMNKAIKKIKPKKSSGSDGLSQEQLVMGAEALIAPLLTIFNKSIDDEKFPDAWKKAIVSPVLKKGDSGLYENYRPVSCLPAASKLLEMIVCEQVTDHLESNKLLPESKHGFRSKRSTMTAWANIIYCNNSCISINHYKSIA